MEKESILIVAGGTGGHISPGVSIFEELQKQGHSSYILSSLRNKDNPDLIESAKNVHWHNPPEFPHSPLRAILFIYKLLQALIQVHKVYKKIHFTKMIAMGGYTSFPALLYCRMRAIPYYLHEQNCVPGKITRMFRRKAIKIFISFPLLKYGNLFDKDKIFKLGNPVRAKILNASFFKKNPNLSSNPKKRKKDSRHILVMGGSQGAKQINILMKDYLTLIEESLSHEKSNISKKTRANTNEINFSQFKNDTFTLITGYLTYEESREQLEKFSNIKIIPYSNDIQKLMLASDLVIARSGAGLICEAPLFALPMILIPYPYAADGHQIYNANYAVSEKSAFLLEGKDITAENLLEIMNTLLDASTYKEYSTNALKIATPESAKNIVTEITSSPSN